MSDILISKDHSLNMDTLKTRIEGLAADLKKKYGIQYVWSGDTCSLSGAGLKKGEVRLTASTLTIDVTLGMLAKMLKPKIEEQISARIGKIVS